MRNRSFLDPVVVAQLGGLPLRARRILDGLYSGHHINLARGHSQDFSEHRAYHPGDDLRTLDWKVYGRTDRLAVRQYEEQTNIGLLVLLDPSASMAFSWGGRLSKLEYGKTLAAALGTLAVSQHDGAGLLAGDVYLPPGTQRGHLERFYEGLETVGAAGVWDPRERGEAVNARLRKRSFIVVISDLLEKGEAALPTFRRLHAQKHEVLVIQVLDPAERDLPFDGPILFEDMETGERLKSEPDVIRAAYRRIVENRLSAYRHGFRSAGIDYLFLTTDTPFDKGLGAYLSWRGAQV